MGEVEELTKKVKEAVFSSLDRLSQNPEAVVVSTYITQYHLRRCLEGEPDYVVKEVKENLVGLL